MNIELDGDGLPISTGMRLHLTEDAIHNHKPAVREAVATVQQLQAEANPPEEIEASLVAMNAAYQQLRSLRQDRTEIRRELGQNRKGEYVKRVSTTRSVFQLAILGDPPGRNHI